MQGVIVHVDQRTPCGATRVGGVDAVDQEDVLVGRRAVGRGAWQPRPVGSDIRHSRRSEGEIVEGIAIGRHDNQQIIVEGGGNGRRLGVDDRCLGGHDDLAGRRRDLQVKGEGNRAAGVDDNGLHPLVVETRQACAHLVGSRRNAQEDKPPFGVRHRRPHTSHEGGALERDGGARAGRAVRPDYTARHRAGVDRLRPRRVGSEQQHETQDEHPGPLSYSSIHRILPSIVPSQNLRCGPHTDESHRKKDRGFSASATLGRQYCRMKGQRRHSELRMIAA